MPPQVTRLILLTIGIVGSYLVARHFLTPSSFGDYGFFRGAAIAEIASHDLTYAGKKACDECHSEQLQKLAKKAHKSLACEGCHGPGKAHAENPDVKMGILHSSHCMRCHEANPSRPKTHKQIVLKNHYNTGEKCTECHLPHEPTEVP
jgi:hypothetical protein